MSTSESRPSPGSYQDDRSTDSSFRKLVRKSALLNLVIVLTSFPVLAWAGGLEAVAPALAIMTGISLIIWAFTFALYSFVSLPRLFQMPEHSSKPSTNSRPAARDSVADRWVDGPG